MLAVSCSCLSYAVCDLYDWTAGVEHENSVLHTVRQYTEENAPEAAASLKEMNTDYVCWLEMEDHSVSLPVVQGDDDAITSIMLLIIVKAAREHLSFRTMHAWMTGSRSYTVITYIMILRQCSHRFCTLKTI